MRALAHLLVTTLLAAALLPAAERPSTLAKQAAKALRNNDPVKAYLLYSQAAAADPSNSSYWTRANALRTRALRESNSLPAALTQATSPTPTSPTPTPSDDSSPILSSITPAELEESRRPLPPAELQSIPGARSFHFRADAKAAFQQVTKAFGIDTVFDADYTPGTPQKIDLDNIDFKTAIHALEAATSSFVVPLGPKLLMIYKDTQQKRTEAEPTMATTLSLPAPITVQDAQELARAVQQLMEIQRFAIDASRRLVLLKDRVSKVRAAQEIYQQLLSHKPQVIIEVELQELSEGDELSYGMTLPTSTALAFLGRSLPSASSRRGPRIIPNIATGFTKFLVGGGGFSTIALAITDAKAFASHSRTSSQALFRSSIRSLDGAPATLHIGDKYPIITQQFQGATGISALATPATFQFEDLGLSLKITPKIHDATDVSLTVEAEFKVLGSGSYNGIPVISNRKFQSTVRLRNGEWAVLAGMVNASEARSISGLPLLASLPLLHHALTSNTRSITSSQALLVLKPYIIDSASTENLTRTIHTGTESRWITLP